MKNHQVNSLISQKQQKPFVMTEQTLSENKTDGEEHPRMIRSYQYFNRIITVWSNGNASISGILFPNEQEAQKQVEFLNNIKVIDAR